MSRTIEFGLATAVVLLACSLGHAQENPPKAWQIEGFKAALNDPDPEVLKAALRFPGAEVLISAMGEAAKDQAPRLGELLRDPEFGNVRSAAARALGAMGEAAKDQAPRLGELLGDPEC